MASSIYVATAIMNKAYEHQSYYEQSQETEGFLK